MHFYCKYIFIKYKSGLKLYQWGENLMNLKDLIKLQEKEKKTTFTQNNYDVKENIELSLIWHSNDEKIWNTALNKYWTLIKHENLAIEKYMEELNFELIKNLNENDFYDFLFDKYFVWKYTAKNRLTTTRTQLNRYKDEYKINKLKEIKEELFSFDLKDTKKGLEIATRIHGLGTAGASGLLSVLFPKYFGTVDQFVVKSLISIKNMNNMELLLKMNPERLSIADGIILIDIMRNRAEQLNNKNSINHWTPRHIDKVLWACGH